MESRFPQHWPQASIMSHIHNHSTAPQCFVAAFKVALCDPEHKGLLLINEEPNHNNATLKLTDNHRANMSHQGPCQDIYSIRNTVLRIKCTNLRLRIYVHVKFENRRGKLQHLPAASSATLTYMYLHFS